MPKSNPWSFLEKYMKDCICQWFKCFSAIYFQLYHKILLFYKGIYLVKQDAIVTYNNNSATVTHYIKSCIVKPITES